MGNANELSTDCAETSVTDGVAYMEAASPLTRLHYFDGKFLKADALSQEQEYHRTRVRLSNQAGGWGVVNGLGIDLNGGQLTVDGGLAITPAGNFVMNVGGVKVDLNELLKVAEPGPVDGNDDFQPCVSNPPKGSTASGLQFYEITVGPIDALCGNEPVYGKLCQSACVSDSQQPYWREGMVLRLRPINLKLPGSVTIGLTSTHLRNRMASAYFLIEPGSTSSQLSKAGLASNIWCGTTSLYGRDEVVIGLLSSEGSTLKIDAWAGRRERMEAQARGFWQGRMAMRPWNVFLAQILQFQCQLSGLFADGITFEPVDQCDDLRAALAKARKDIELLHKKYAASSEKLVQRFTGKPTKADAEWAVKQAQGSANDLYAISKSLDKIDTGTGVMPINRLLLNNGFQQLPPAGFLPVELNQKPLTEQISRWFGEGVRLHYHAVRADEIGHLVEQAQHMERISLTKGLDDPKSLEDVEIFLPDGQVTSASIQTSSTWWQVDEDGVTAFIVGLALNNTSNDNSGNDTVKAIDSISAAMKDQMQAEKARLRSYQTGGTDIKRMSRLSIFDQSIALKGLARTDARSDGSFGLTMVAGTVDAYQPIDVLNRVKAPAEIAFKLLDTTGANDTMSGGTQTDSTDNTPATIRSYLAADIDTDPFLLDEGQMVPARLETHISSVVTAIDQADQVVAITAQGEGGLTVTSKREIVGRLTELIVEISMSGQVTSYTQPAANGPSTVTEATNYKMSFKLTRRTGAQGGTLAAQAMGDNGEIPGVFKWQINPLMASFKIQVPVLEGAPTGTSLYGLSGMPAAKALLHTNANKMIDQIAGLSFDPSFGLRAQQRLFDDGIVTTTESIEATQDWLMFRRARTLLCDPNCQGRVESTDEAVQVWHLKVADAAELKQLVAALDSNNAKALSGFNFNEIGVLHYANESAESIEPHAAVHTMWELAKPGNSVVAGRTWERQPATGQGWQNHTRVFNMLNEVTDLTTPPDDVGQGVIKVVKRAPAPLEDGTLDGGMLVVTMDVEVAALPHRVIMLPKSLSARVFETFNKDPEVGWTDLLSQLAATISNKLVVEDLIVNFASGKLEPDSGKALDEARKSMANKLADANDGAQVVGRYALRLTSKAVEPAVDPIGQHKVIMDALSAIQLPGAPDHFDVAASNLGSGAEVVSLIFFDINQVTGPA